MRRLVTPCIVALAHISTPACAQEVEEAGPAIGTEIFISDDSDDTTVWRLAADFDLQNEPNGSRLGLRVEKAWYDPLGLGTYERERVFLQAADGSGNVNWSARVGTDGETIIGSASINDNQPFRKEAFIERDVVETPTGLERGIYSTFAGAAIDLPADESNIVTLLAGVQEFTGDNVRLHLRGNFVHVLDRDAGISAQLRTRYFHSTVPGEYDYFSPEDYGQILPVLQMRRFIDGWQLLAAGGIGVQRSTGADWKQANYLEVRVASPTSSAWFVSGEAVYSQTPGANTAVNTGYEYLQTRFSLTRRF